MTPNELQLAAHQIGMVRAAKTTDPQALAEWREHQKAAAGLRTKVGSVFQVYPFPNRALVKALTASLNEHLITRADFAACLQNVIGEYR